MQIDKIGIFMMLRVIYKFIYVFILTSPLVVNFSSYFKLNDGFFKIHISILEVDSENNNTKHT